MTSPQKRFDEISEKADFVFSVFFRGHWCPFCMSWLKSLQNLVPKIRRANGQVVAITAEPQPFLNKTLETTGFTGEVILDPGLDLVDNLKTRGLVDVAVTSKSGYPNGMIQPAILVINREGEALFSWAIKPGVMNLGGAKDRPVLAEVWQDIQGMLNGDISKPRENYTKGGLATGLKQKMFG